MTLEARPRGQYNRHYRRASRTRRAPARLEHPQDLPGGRGSTSIWLEDNGEHFYAVFEDGLGSALFGELARPEEFQVVDALPD